MEESVKIAYLIKQLDAWIEDCQKKSDSYFERNMRISEIGSVAMKIAYENVKKLLLQK